MDVYRGQKGRAVLIARDAEGRVTQSYDEARGIMWSLVQGPEDVAQIADEDANPWDAEVNTLRAHAEGEDDTVFEVEFDGKRGDEESLVRARSQNLRVLEPPPGEAVSAEFVLEFEQVQDPTP